MRNIAGPPVRYEKRKAEYRQQLAPLLHHATKVIKTLDF